MIGCPNASRRAGVLERDLQRAARGAERAGGDVQARLVERHHREPEALAVGAEQLARRVRRTAAPWPARRAARAGPRRGRPSGPRRRRSTRNAEMPRVGARPDREHVAHRAVRDVQLRAGDAEPVAVAAGRSPGGAAASDPAAGSVRQKHGISVPSATPGSTRARCSASRRARSRRRRRRSCRAAARTTALAARDALDRQHRRLEADLDAAVLGRDARPRAGRAARTPS